MTLKPRFQGHSIIFRPMNAFDVLSAQLTRDLFAIAKFLLLLVTSASDLLVHTIRFCSVVFGVTSSLAVIHTIHRDCLHV